MQIQIAAGYQKKRDRGRYEPHKAAPQRTDLGLDASLGKCLPVGLVKVHCPLPVAMSHEADDLFIHSMSLISVVHHSLSCFQCLS